MSRAMEYHSDAVEKMDVQGCGMGDSGLQQLLPGLLSCTRLKVLDLSWNNLSKSHMGSEGVVIGRNRQSLEELDLSLNAVGDEGLRCVGHELQQVQWLKCLRLRDLGLTHTSAHLLADILSHQPALVKCNLSSNRIGDSSFAGIGSALREHKHIEELRLSGTDLTSRSMGLLASMLASFSHLRNLDIRDNLIGEVGFKLLSSGLQQCLQLRQLYLDECGLTGDGQVTALLTMMLLCVPKLEVFSLTENRIGDAGICQLCIGLEECHQLTKLWLDDIGMASSQSIMAVSRLLRRLNMLQWLAIDNNPYSGSSNDMQLCTAVKGHPSLLELYVPEGMNRDAISRLESFANDSTCALKILEEF